VEIDRYVVEPIVDQPDNAYRAVAWLRTPEVEKRANAYQKFQQLRANEQRAIRTGFDRYLQGLTANKRHHGWDPKQHGGIARNLHVFKNNNHRFYAFKCRPLSDYQRFELCVVVVHATKNQAKTEIRLLRLAKFFSDDNGVRDAVAVYIRGSDLGRQNT